jgi:nucleotide-binding universal stress UspA family protein
MTYPPRSVLIPTDGSDGADRALGVADDLATAVGAGLHLLHVVDTASLGFDVRSAVADETLSAKANEVLERALQQVDDGDRDDVETAVAYGRVYREILNYIEAHDVDLVAVGTQGEAAFSRYTMGSVTAKILRTSPVPVLMTGDPDAE